MRINHNIAALNTYRQLSSNNVQTGKSLEKLSSGLRINRAGDDAAGLAISEKMRAQIRGLDQASRNAQDSISLIQTSEGALSETHDILQRMRELAVQSSSDTNVTVDRDSIQKEMNQLTSEINRIGNTTEFNTQKLLNGDKANTFTVTGTSFAGGSGTSTIQGLTTTLATGATALSSGDYKLVVSKTTTSGTIAASSGTGWTVTDTAALNVGVTLAPVTAQVTYGGATKATFSGNTITLTSGSGNLIPVAGGVSGTLDIYQSGGFLIVSGTYSGASVIHDTVAISGNTATYNNFGISFGVNVSGWASGNGAGMHFSNDNSFTGNIGTFQDVWSTVVLASNTAAGPTFSGGISTSGAGLVEGTWTVTYKLNVGATAITGVTVHVSGGVSGQIIDDVLSGSQLSGTLGGYYNAHGVSFNLATIGSLASGNQVFTFDVAKEVTHLASSGSGVAQTYYSNTFTAALYDVSGNSVGSGFTLGSTTNASGASGLSADILTANNSGTVGNNGLSVVYSGGSVAEGSGIFTVSRTTTGEDKSLTFQIGANQNQSMSLSISDMRAKALGISSATAVSGFSASVNVSDGTNATSNEFGLDVSTTSGAAKAITIINNAINTVSSERSKLGANQNRLEHTINNLGTSSENLQSAESRVRDVDMARQMMEFTKSNILSQAAQAMLAQANQQPQGVLQLLR